MKFFDLSKNVASKIADFLSLFWALDGLERSGRPVGIISTYLERAAREYRRPLEGIFRVRGIHLSGCEVVFCDGISMCSMCSGFSRVSFYDAVD